MKWLATLLVLLGLNSVSWACTDKPTRDSAIAYANSSCVPDPITCVGCTSEVLKRYISAANSVTHVYMDCQFTYPPSWNMDPTIFNVSSYTECSGNLGAGAGPGGGCRGGGMCCAGGGGSSGGAASPNETVPGSIIRIDTQGLSEVIPLLGTDFDLIYATEFIKDRTGFYKAVIPVTGSDVSSNTSAFNLKIYNEANTQLVNQNFSTTADQTYTYTWNGNNSSGNPVEGSINYTYKITETNSVAGSIEFNFPLILGHFQAKSIGLGHWLPSIFRFYDIPARRIAYTSGNTRTVEAIYNSTTGRYEVPEADGSEFNEFDATGRIKFIKTGITGEVKYEFNYDGSGRLTSIEDGYGRTTTFNRNGSNVWTSITTPYNKTITATIDGSGRLTKITQPSSDEYEMTYVSSTAMLSTFEKPNGAVSTFDYDADGNLTEDAHSGGFVQNLVRTVNTAREVKVEYSKSGKSALLTTTNDPVLGVRKVEDSTAPTKDVTYDGDSLSNSYAGFSTAMTTTNHSRFGTQAKRVTSASGGELGAGYRSQTFSESVTLSTPTDPFSISAWTKTTTLNGQDTTDSYNPSTKKWTTTTPMGNTSNYTMDVHERVVQTQIGNLTPVDYTYTNEHLTEVEQGARTTTYTYSNTTGLLTSVTDPLSQTTSYTYDTNERLASITRPDSNVVYLTYNSVGQLSSITPVSRPTHNFSFNSSELMSAYTPPTLSGLSSPQTTYTYSNNKIATITRPDSKVITYSYDSTSGLMTSIATTEATIAITRDTNTNLPSYLSSADRHGVRMSYQGQVMATETTEEPNSTTFAHYYSRQYDGTTTKISYEDIYVGSSSSPISFTYNNDEQLATAGDVTYTYSTPNAFLDEVVTGSSSDQIAAHTYNSFGELLTQTTEVASTQVHELTLTYDGMGRIKTKKDDIPSVTTPDYDYTYDSLGRLITVKDGATTISSYTYDNNGNRTQKVENGSTTINYTYDNQDRLTAVGSYTFAYNHHGEMTSRTNTFLSQTTSYVYDSFGNLTQVTLPNSDVIDYEIDAKNRRIGKIVNSTLEVRYIYADDLRIIAEVNPNFTIKRRYIYGSKMNIPDYYIEGSDKFRIISDQLGTPRIVINMGTGAVVAKWNHDEFGNITANTNTGLKLPFGFAGGLQDWDTGLIRFGARDYDPVLGRWLSKDPILFNGGDMNLYGYVMNDPVNFVDPKGNFGIVAGIIAGVVVGAGVGVLGELLNGCKDRDKLLDALMYGGMAGGMAGLGAQSGLIGAVLGQVLGISIGVALGPVGAGTNFGDFANGIKKVRNNSKCNDGCN